MLYLVLAQTVAVAMSMKVWWKCVDVQTALRLVYGFTTVAERPVDRHFPGKIDKKKNGLAMNL